MKINISYDKSYEKMKLIFMIMLLIRWNFIVLLNLSYLYVFN